VFSQPAAIRLTTLLLGDTDGPATATGGLGVLTADAEAPVVTETTVGADLLEALEVLAELGGDAVGEDLRVLAVDDIALTVEEPAGDLVLAGVLDDGDDALELLGGELTGTLVQVDCVAGDVSVRPCSIDTKSFSRVPSWERLLGVERTIGLLANNVGVAATNTGNLGQSVHDLLLTPNVGVCEENDVRSIVPASLARAPPFASSMSSSLPGWGRACLRDGDRRVRTQKSENELEVRCDRELAMMRTAERRASVVAGHSLFSPETSDMLGNYLVDDCLDVCLVSLFSRWSGRREVRI
jgi:hypothetical protein